MLKIIIARKKEQIIFSDGSMMATYPALVCEDESYLHIKSLIRSGELQEVEVYLQRYWWTPKKLTIASHIRQGIVKFLNHYHIQADMFFDCYAFANLVHGITSHSVAYARRYWYLSVLKSSPKPGETIFLVREEEKVDFNFRHAAICIAPDLFVSVYGAWGDLEFATLEDMKKEFEATFVLRAVPRT